MRIGIVTPWFPTPDTPYGGIFVAQQALALVEAGHEVSVVHLDAKPATQMSTAEAAVAADVFARAVSPSYRGVSPTEPYGLYRVPFISPSSSGFHARAVSATESLDHAWPGIVRDSGDFDLLHAHVALPAGFASLRGYPLVVTEHYTGVGRILSQGAARQAFEEVVVGSAFICVSDFLRSEITATLGEQWRQRVAVVPNMVDFEGLDFRPRETIGERWLFVGSLNPRKNVDRLLRVLREYHAVGRDAHLTIVGDGEQRESLEQLARDIGVAPSVSFVGGLDPVETAHHFQSSDLLVHLSSLETFGLTAVESISSGMPVVSLANGGAECAWGEIERIAGLIASPYLDEVAIARRIAGLCTNADSLDLATASDWVRRKYAPQVIVDSLSRIYAEVSR